MDARHFDQVTREIGAGLPRRGLLGWLVALLLGWRISLTNQEPAAARGRRQRRKKRHKHRRMNPGRKRKQRRRQRRKRRKKKSACTPGQPCGAPGQICQPDRTCACTRTSCPECQLCDAASGVCVSNPGATGAPCGDPIQVCQADGTCACPEVGCGGVCGCPNGFICVDGSCEDCDVTFNGDRIASGEALQTALDGGGTIRVCPGRYQGNFELRNNVTVIGAGDGDDPATSTILDAGGSGRTIQVSRHISTLLQGIRITGGDYDGTGGGVYVNGGLELISCTISGNSASVGGGIYAAFDATGVLTLNGCRVVDNHADRAGAGIHNNHVALVTIDGCTFARNRCDDAGGAIYNNSGAITISNSEIVNNEARNNGGGIYNADSVTQNPGNLIFDAATRVRNNRAGGDGGGIYNKGTVTLNGASVSGNTPNNCGGDPVAGCLEDS
jgi:predicted outer membrane repeat protein